MADERLDARTVARLGRGEILVHTEPVPGSSAPRLVMRAMVQAPPERVWAIIDDCANYRRNMAGVKDSRELSRQGDVVRVQVTVGMPFPLKDLTSVTEGVHTVTPGRYCREWKLVQGDYHANSGSWTLVCFEDDPDRTLVHYRLHAEPKIRIPGALQKVAQKKAAPKIIEQLRRQLR